MLKRLAFEKLTRVEEVSQTPHLLRLMRSSLSDSRSA